MKYSKENLESLCRTSFSYREVLILLNLIPRGGNYRTLKKYISLYNIETSHFKKPGYNLKPNNRKYTLEEILKSNSHYSSNKLKKRLIKEGYFDAKCYNCNLSHWLNKPIILELEHIDGDNTNNTIENLTLLCPNCHSQTKTWRGRNNKSGSGRT